MDNLLTGSARHFELLGGLRRFDYLMLNLPYICNYRCEKCCNYREESVSGEALTLGEINKLIDDGKDLGMRVLVIAGEGEPFLDNRIMAIIQHANAAELIPYIFTNGSKLDKDTAQFLKENKASLVINVDSLNEGMYDRLTGVKNGFRVAYENIQGIRGQFKDTYTQIGVYGLRRIAINTVVSVLNQGELAQIKDFCQEDFAFVCNTPMKVGKAAGNSIFSEAVSIVDTIPLGTTSDGLWCAYMRNGISVGAKGEILTCGYSLDSEGFLGNVRNGGLKRYRSIANSAVDDFYNRHGHCRCILRHPRYDQFIQGLKEMQ